MGLARCGPAGAAPGQAKKLAIIGSLDHVTRQLIVHTSQTKRSRDFIAHLEQLDHLFGPPSIPRVTYGLGAKVPFPGAVPGRDFQKVDCSGFVREAVRRSTQPTVAFPDGSVVQHEWVCSRGYEHGAVADGAKTDKSVRIAFLSPQASPQGIGHVVLIYQGKTLELHGGVGPDSRPWTGTGWQSKVDMFVLTRAAAAIAADKLQEGP